jgi:uncharacterized protein (TIGR03067 family)
MRCFLIAVGLLIALPISAFADSCRFLEHDEAKSANGRYLFRMDQAGKWKGRLEDTKTGKISESALAGLGFHLHSSAFVTDDGSRVVVFEPSVEYNEGGILLVYDADLKLLKGFSFRELLTEIDMKAARHSVSHCRFLANGRDGKRPYGLDAGEKTFSMLLKSKRTAIVSLKEPKIVPTPDVIPEVFEFEEGLPPGKTDLERFQGKWMVTDGRAGIMGTDPDSFTEDPRYYTFEGDKIHMPECRFDNYTFRFDESVTPHAIDLFEPGKLEPVKGIYEFSGGKLRFCTPDGPEKPRPKTLDGEGFGVEDWTSTLQRRKPKK